MPTYEYQCDKCEKQFEYFQSIKEDPKSECEECGGKLTRLLSGGTGLIFKGSGFYITDYKSKGGEPASGGSHGGSGKKESSSGGDSKSGGSDSKPSGESKSSGGEAKSASSAAKKD